MKKLFFLTILFIQLINASAQNSLSGTITDAKDQSTLTGATIFITDLKVGTAADLQGKYQLNNLPKGTFLITISFVGYGTFSEKIKVEGATVKDFSLSTSAVESREVIVTGVSKATEARRTPTPISVISNKQLTQTVSTNIIDALAKQPGISQVSTGSGISKPVIRGLGYNRVITVNDGIRQEGQQWGDEHGIEIDENGVNKVEILKGPASLSYGSDAMAGVINFIDNPTVQEGKVKGKITTNYQTNNGLYSFGGNIAGNQKGFIWAVTGGIKNAHAYQNKYDGYVFNSSFAEQAVKATVGLSKKWGYSHLIYSFYNLKPGLVEGERDSATGKFLKPIALNDSTEGSAIATSKDFKTYSAFIPMQNINHQKIVWNNYFALKNGSIKALLAWQQNNRQEFPDVLNPNQYGLFFHLYSFHYDLKYDFETKNNYSISIGSNGMNQISENKGIEFLIPEYNLLDAGIYSIIHKSFDKLDIQGGIRYDARTVKSKSLYLDGNDKVSSAADTSAIQKFSAVKSTYTGISGGLGFTYQLGKSSYLKLNYARGFRSPNIAELAANGVHEGTLRYEIGNTNLKSEASNQLDFTFGTHSTHVSFEMDLFANNISNFVYLSKLPNISGGDSVIQGFTAFKFSSADVQLYGGEFTLDIHPHPLDWLHFENTMSFVQSMQTSHATDSTKYLPFTPPMKITSELRIDLAKAKGNFKNSFFKLEMENFAAQKNIYSAYATETPTPGYTLFNAGIGTTIISKKQKEICSVILAANNLTDVAYQSHLSRLKYAAVNNVTGRTGVYNMGRNISLKLQIPIGFETAKAKK